METERELTDEDFYSEEAPRKNFCYAVMRENNDTGESLFHKNVAFEGLDGTYEMSFKDGSSPIEIEGVGSVLFHNEGVIRIEGFVRDSGEEGTKGYFHRVNI